MEQERSIDRLARYLIGVGTIAILAWLCWYFKNVLIYIIAAFVVSLIGQPVMRLLRKITIKGKSAPNWLLAIITILLILGVLILIVTQAIPVVTNIVRDAAVLNSTTATGNPLDRINDWIISLFPSLGPDFDVIAILMDKLKEVTNVTNVTAVISSVTSFVTSFAVGLFSIVFISFFFVRDENLFRKIVSALVPDRMEGKIAKALGDIESLLSRYFVGLLIEMTGVALLDFLGLWIIARLGFSNALGIAFIAGILNIIPYDRRGGGRGPCRHPQVRHRRRAGREHLGVRTHRAGHHAHDPARGQLCVSASYLFHQHQGQPVGDLHRDPARRAHRRRPGHAGRHPVLHRDPRHRQPVLPGREGRKKTDSEPRRGLGIRKIIIRIIL